MISARIICDFVVCSESKNALFKVLCSFEIEIYLKRKNKNQVIRQYYLIFILSIKRKISIPKLLRILKTAIYDADHAKNMRISCRILNVFCEAIG